MSICKGCGAPIRFIKTPAGKSMPVNETPQKYVTEAGEVVTGYTPHWATCPKAQEFRKAKK